MTTKDPKIRWKDLRAPDEFQTATQQALTFVRSHERETVLAAVGLFVLLAVVLGVSAYRSWRADKAGKEFRQGFRSYLASDLDGAAKAFDSLATHSPGLAAGELAALYSGAIAIQRDDRAKAGASFEMVAESSDEAALEQIAEYNLGVLKRNTGDAASEEHFEKAASLEGPLRGAAVVALAAKVGEKKSEVPAEILNSLPEDLREFVAGSKAGS